MNPPFFSRSANRLRSIIIKWFSSRALYYDASVSSETKKTQNKYPKKTTRILHIVYYHNLSYERRIFYTIVSPKFYALRVCKVAKKIRPAEKCFSSVLIRAWAFAARFYNIRRQRPCYSKTTHLVTRESLINSRVAGNERERRNTFELTKNTPSICK